MKLDSTEDFYVVADAPRPDTVKGGGAVTEQQFYKTLIETSKDILEARRFSDRYKVHAFMAEIKQAGISQKGVEPAVNIIRIDITVAQHEE